MKPVTAAITFLSLALDFLRLQLKIPSQVVQFIEELATAGRVSPILLVRLRLREIAQYFSAPWQLSQLPRIENRRLGFEPLG